MADNVDKFGIEIDLDVSGLQAELIKSQNELRKFQSQLKASTDTTEIAKLTASITILDDKIGHLGTRMGDVKKPTGDATQSLVNLSRIAQDAPYGFIGIANNLNPLLESFQQLSKKSDGAGGALKSMVAGLTGPAGIGLALGVVSSLVVAFGDDISNFVQKLFDAGSATKEMKTAISGIGGEFTSAVEKVNKVAVAFDLFHKGLITGDEALSVYNKSLGANYGLKKNINEAEATFKEKTKDYIQAQLQRALADAASAEAAKKLLEKEKLGLEGPKVGFFNILQSSVYGTAGPQAARNMAANRLKEQQAEIQKEIDGLINIQQKAEEFANTIANKAGVDINTETTKDLEKETAKQEAILSKSAKTKQQIAEERLKEEIAILEAENAASMKWADNEMKIYNRMLEFYKKYGDIVKAETSVSSMREMLAKQDKEREKKEDSTPFSERKISTKGTSVEREENRIKKFDKELEASKKTLEGYSEFISGTLTQGIMTMWDAMQQGESPLKALGDYLGDVAKKFAFAIIQATIFNGVMLLLNALTGGAAGEFMGVISSSSKLLGLAEGGIVSRPTLAMVGEGGQSEAVMPLNKLGNMMNSTFNAGAMSGTGAGNGQFVLKGNDLVLALQRSNYSLNLRRGNGI
jgi:hypothetical protein